MNHVVEMNKLMDMIKTLHCMDFCYEELSGKLEDHLNYVSEEHEKIDSCYERNSANLEKKLYRLLDLINKEYNLCSKENIF